MQFKVTEFNPLEINELVEFLSGEKWEFHGTPNLTTDKIKKNFDEGFFTGSGVKSFWIYDGDKKIGTLRLFDLGDGIDDDETPLFDIKITKNYRGKGVGQQALQWLTDFVFNTYPNKNRFEATTRIDNIAMRKVFEKCGFVKEAHYRRAWPDKQNNTVYDCAGYAILRSDWQTKSKTLVNFEQ